MYPFTEGGDRRRGSRPRLLAAFTYGMMVASALAAGCSKTPPGGSTTASAGAPPLTGNTRVQTDSALRQQVIDAQKYQIEHSAMSADQKQRALQQLQTSVPR